MTQFANSPLESSCVVVALRENYNTSKPLKVKTKKSQILSCDTVVVNEQHMNTAVCKRVETPSDAMPTIHGTSFRGFIIPLNYHRFR
jgi:hypothetical protein